MRANAITTWPSHGFWANQMVLCSCVELECEGVIAWGECVAGEHQVCPEQTQPGFTHWGSLAELVALDVADVNLVRLPDDLDDVTAAAGAS